LAGPLLTTKVHEAMRRAREQGVEALGCSLDLERSTTLVGILGTGWTWQGCRYPYLASCRDRTVYYWTGEGFEAVSRYAGSLIKMVPTGWGPPTFEIDGIKMLPTSRVSPYEDARRKVALIEPRGKAILDTCGGLGYFVAWCIEGGAARVLSFEKNPDVLWLRKLNPWSPGPGGALELVEADVTGRVASLPEASFDAILHDPPRFGIAGELYSADFYRQLARVIRRRGRLFHYTGAPNRASRGRDLASEVAARLADAGFEPRTVGDGVLAVRGR
jgi:predicted methyltransferase